VDCLAASLGLNLIRIVIGPRANPLPSPGLPEDYARLL